MNQTNSFQLASKGHNFYNKPLISKSYGTAITIVLLMHTSELSATRCKIGQLLVRLPLPQNLGTLLLKIAD